MKQKIAMMIAGSILVLSFALAGCGSEQQTSSETESTSQTVSRQSFFRYFIWYFIRHQYFLASYKFRVGDSYCYHSRRFYMGLNCKTFGSQ